MTSTPPSTYLFKNNTLLPPSSSPPISTFLQSHPGAYTTTRTHSNASTLLFYDRHVTRLSHSLNFLLHSNPRLLFGPHFSGPTPFPSSINFDELIRRRVGPVVRDAVPIAMEGKGPGEELAVSALIGGSGEGWDGEGMGLDVYVHIGMYVPPVFGESGARCAVIAGKREFAQAKYSDWARLRKPLELLRPPSATELLLSEDGNRILEGTLTNFFAVCYKGSNEGKGKNSHDGSDLHLYELQTAPLKDGVLPGVIRQLVIEICLRKGIAIREVSPCWSERGIWEEAFITSSLRLVQHVEAIQAPSSWTSIKSKSFKEVSWVEKQFKGGPGMVTALIQREIMKKAGLEGISVALLDR